MRNTLKNLWWLLTAPFRLIWWLLKLFPRMAKSTWNTLSRFLTEEPEDTPLAVTLEKAARQPMDFFQALLVHLAALRWHLLRSILVMAITIGLILVYTPQIIDWLAAPIGGIQSLTAIQVTEPLSVTMRVAVLGGFSIALPYIAFELLLFAAEGLSRRARITGLFAIPIVTLFFAAGMAFAYYLMLPPAIHFLLGFSKLNTTPTPSSYVQLATGLMFWVGISFELPLVSYGLSAMGLLRPEWLLKNARLAIVFMAVVAAAITPTVDPVNMTIVLLPLIALYYLSIGMSYLARGRRKARTGA